MPVPQFSIINEYSPLQQMLKGYRTYTHRERETRNTTKMYCMCMQWV